MPPLELTKYHALGNDFLILVDAAGGAGGTDPGPGFAASVCARHTGVGADGLIRLSPATAPGSWLMVLRNADGGIAETSGNGLRCAALALVDAGLVPDGEVRIETAGTTAVATLVARRGEGSASLRVTMGAARLGAELGGVLGRRARFVDVGNPHLVLFPDPAAPPPRRLAALELSVLEHGPDGELPGGVNVESVDLVAGSSADAGPARSVDMVVYERGAGATQACGSGSVAVAVALRAAGLTGDELEVVNPGGTLVVELSGPPEQPAAVLTGPAQRIALISLDADWFGTEASIAP